MAKGWHGDSSGHSKAAKKGWGKGRKGHTTRRAIRLARERYKVKPFGKYDSDAALYMVERIKKSKKMVPVIRANRPVSKVLRSRLRYRTNLSKTMLVYMKK